MSSIIELVKHNPYLSACILFGVLGQISKKAFYLALFLIIPTTVDIVSGKTTTVDVNLIASVSICLSLVGNGFQYLQNKKLKKKISEKEGEEK